MDSDIHQVHCVWWGRRWGQEAELLETWVFMTETLPGELRAPKGLI